MKKLVLLFTIILFSIISPAQEKVPSITPFGGLTGSAYFTNLEYGGLIGINWKDRLYVAGFTSFDLGSNTFSGLFIQYTINPSDNGFHLGLSTKIGLYNRNYLSVDLIGIEAQWILNDHIVMGPRIGMLNGLPSVDFKILMGNFKPRYWRNYWMAKKIDKMEDDDFIELSPLFKKKEQVVFKKQ